MRKNWFSFFFAITVLLFFTNCRKASTEMPAFLKCDSVIIATSSVGPVNSGIYGLYMTVGNDIRGTWQLPFKMPVLKEGLNTFLINPIIKANNLSTLFVEYPLLKSQLVPLDLKPGGTIDTILTFEYVDSIQVRLDENMEVSTNFTNSVQSPNSRNGSFSMEMKADFNSPDSSAVAFYSKQISFTLGKTSFLEFDYYMPEGVLGIALAFTDANGNTSLRYGVNFLNKNTAWTHVYYDLGSIVDGLRASGLYTPVFILTPAKGASSSQIFLDNLKILEN